LFLLAFFVMKVSPHSVGSNFPVRAAQKRQSGCGNLSARTTSTKVNTNINTTAVQPSGGANKELSCILKFYVVGLRALSVCGNGSSNIKKIATSSQQQQHKNTRRRKNACYLRNIFHSSVFALSLFASHTHT
jgi:hypothetical protein